MLGPRQSGRTTRQLWNLPDGGFYIVNGRGEVNRYKEICYRMNKPNIQILVIGELYINRFRGLENFHYDVDHHVFEVLNETNRRKLEELKTIHELARR